MGTDPSLAFASLSARAASQPDGAAPDRISLRDHVVDVEIGAFQVERDKTQRVAFDVVVEVAPPPAPLDDDVDRILSYETITHAITRELAAQRLNLLETLAERIAAHILRAPQALRVFLRIQKLDRGPGALGVEIIRPASGAPTTPPPGTPAPVSPPLMIFLSNQAVASDRLPDWLDQLQQLEKPVIICVGPAGRTAPVASAAPAQRRIDLLAIEQNAWVLAARDQRCLVVDSKAEFDWAARNQRIAVWAPSKIVLDAVADPSPPPADAVALFQWFAVLMQAQGLTMIDAEPPAGSPIPATTVALDQNIS